MRILFDVYIFTPRVADVVRASFISDLKYENDDLDGKETYGRFALFNDDAFSSSTPTALFKACEDHLAPTKQCKNLREYEIAVYPLGNKYSKYGSVEMCHLSKKLRCNFLFR